MTRFLFLTWDGGGNEPPALGLAGELRNRGHHVVFAGYASQRARITERGFRFVLLERSQEVLASLSRTPGLRVLIEGILLCAPQTTEVAELATRENADVLVIDCMMFAALTAAELGGIPTAVLIHSPPGALFHPDRVLGQVVPAPLNAMRAAVHLSPVDQLWDTWRGMTAICTSIRELDPLGEDISCGCTYVGPILEPASPSDWLRTWSRDDQRPLILVSFSTSGEFEQRSRIERTLEGLAATPYRVLVTTGRTDIRGIEAPANAILLEYAPHGEILGEVAATVTHGGHGTVIASLAHGVPLAALPNPLVADQTPLALQVERLGAGLTLDGERATPGDIARAVEALVTIPAYRKAARALAQPISRSPGLAGAASQVAAISTGTPPHD